MKWWPGWDLTKSPFDEGQICDQRSYGGIIRGVLFFSCWLWVAWYMDDFFAWLGVKGYEQGIPPREQEWHRLITIGMAIVGYVSALASAAHIFVQRRKRKKSIKGQWYDTQILTKQDLEYNEPEHEETDGLPVNQDLPRPR